MARRFVPPLALMVMRPILAVVAVASVAYGCSFEPPSIGAPDASTVDTGTTTRDSDAATAQKDAGTLDASDVLDAGVDEDAAVQDASVEDGGTPDAGDDNQLPVAVNDQVTTPIEVPIEIDVLANDSDPDGDTLVIVSVGTAQNGTAVITAQQSIEYQPTALFSGTDGFDYTISDERGGEAVAHVQVDVQAPPLTIAPANADMNLNSRITFGGAGGVAPYVFQIASGRGRVDASTGAYFSPGTPGEAVVSVQDALGQTASATVTFGTGDLFFLGGVGGNATSQVYRSADGASWTNLPGSLPSPRYLLSAVVFEDAIYVVGGRDDFDDATEVVLRSTDGVTWDDTRTGPVALRGSELVVFQERLFLIGGRDDAGVDRRDVWSSTDGDNWVQEGDLLGPRAYGSAVVHEGTLFYVGGVDVNVEQTVWYTTDGVTWDARTDLPAPRRHTAIASFGSEIWVIGGNDAGDGGQASVWTSADGTTWSSGPQLPVGLGGACAVGWGGQIWVVGGGVNYFPMGARDQSRVLTGSGWVTAGRLQQALLWGALVIFEP